MAAVESLVCLRIFIASPGGLDAERRAFRELIHSYNDIEANPRGVTFKPVGWENTLGEMGERRAQEVINQDLRECHFFLLVLHTRWGSSPGGGYTSGCEEEYEEALKCLEAGTMKQMGVLFKAVSPDMLADPGPQLKKVLKFRKKLEKEWSGLYKTFDDARSFEDLLRRYLAHWCREHDGRSFTVPPDLTEFLPPEPTESTKPPVPGEPEESLVRAQRLADEGHLVEAELLFAQEAVKGDREACNRYGHFLRRLGRLSSARGMYERVLELAGKEEVWTAVAYGNLGLIYLTWGELQKAEDMHRKSLNIDQHLGRRRGMAAAYGNLGNVYKTRGELQKAEEAHKKALEINQQLDRKKGIAAAYGNLGNVYKTRGELRKAEKMHKKSLKLETQLGRKEGMAADYGNLGAIYQTRGELQIAEKMHKKSLKLETQLGRKEGMAIQYGNLGSVYTMRGELQEAEDMFNKALEIDQRLENKEGMARHQGNLGNVYQTRGELQKAEMMYNKALEINQQLSRLEGLAITYGNLGNLEESRSNPSAARSYYEKTLDLWKTLGNPGEVTKLEAALAALDDD